MKIEMTIREALDQFYKNQAKLSAYGHAMSLIYYDGATTAPKGTAQNRAHALSILSEDMYKFSTSDETLALLEFLDEHKAELGDFYDSAYNRAKKLNDEIVFN